MNEQEAKKLIRETFQNPFDEARFRLFAINLFNDLDESKAFSYHGQYIPDAYKEHVKQYKRVGKFRDPEGAELDVLIVNLKKEAALDRARTMQRNFIAWYLKKKDREAAIVAYHSDEMEDWRFSYVRMDYRTVEEKGKVKVKEELTPARRYSFLVGKNEPNHTPQQQLLPILQDDRNNPTLSELEKAFNIESVTKEFFEKYKNLFLKAKEELDLLITTDRKIRDDFASKKIETADFAKKLLGQIVFLYFLQKKGWLGVEKDDAGNFKGWGSGPKGFLRQLFDKRIVAYDNFFNDLLEPLFYEALAIDRGVESFYSPFKCKIPFLNGGLFEPVCGYNWQETDILIKNEVFALIFDTFDLYNFTVREDEPLEKEVAVDPEMLGKVFENLLEVKDRKSKGAFYTPREIVHYMCQESLINYLDTAVNTRKEDVAPQKHIQRKLFGTPEPEQLAIVTVEHREVIPREDIECFTRHGVFAIEHDRMVEAKGRETRDYQYHLPEAIRMNARLIDKALADIKICDIAIGSGAFPVGILHEIVIARETLTAYIGESPERTRYDFKRHAIQESIYGVDIDASAVDIAKLRLWLSLVVDEENFETIKPLPNLDYKIVCGNSLLGVKRDLLNNHLFKELEALKQQFFDETNPRKKKEEKEKIDRLIKQITNNDEHFDFEIYFSEVFHQQCGFDITIGNPPYVRHEAIKEQKLQLSKQFGSFYCGTADLYTYFYKKGLDELRPGGHLCFIAPNKFMRAGYGKNTRALLTREATPKVVIDFGDLPIFDATTYPSILLLEKRFTPTLTLPRQGEGKIEKYGQTIIPPPLAGGGEGVGETFLAATFTDPSQLERIEETLATIGFSMPVSALRPEGWNLERPEVHALMEKLRAKGKPLGEYVEGRFYRGVLTGLNEAFVIDAATRERLIAEDPKSAELIKPWLRGRDIRKWKAEWAGLYLITIASSANREWPWSKEKTEPKARELFAKAYPAIHKYLSQYEGQLIKRDDQGKFWWELRSCAYYEEFERPKITYAEISTEGKFLIDTSGYFSDTTTYIMASSSEYLLAVLNSRLFTYMFSKTSSEISGGFFRWKRQYMEQLPIFSATDAQKAPIIERVKKILAAQEPHPHPDPPLEGEGTTIPPRPQGEGWGEGGIVPRLEAEIDRLVYELYGLAAEEIKVVEGKG